MAKSKPPNFHAVVSEAVSDIADHGFDSEGRLEKWLAKLRVSAESILPSEAQLDRMMRDSLVSIFKKLVDGGEIAQVHQGVSLFTINKLRPQLKVELDKRIMASASLIKLNRKQAIDKTLARFAGWTTSIPAGGTAQANKTQQKGEIKKAMASLPFEERRVLIDQGTKLTASISDVIAKDGGALAMIWHSRWRQPNYNYREDHKDRDEGVWAIRGNWAIAKGLMKPGPNGYYDTITAVSEEPFCRCYAEWIYNIRELPNECLTAKGRAALADARAKLAS